MVAKKQTPADRSAQFCLNPDCQETHDLRAPCLQSYEWPHGGPADTLRTSHRADNGPPWLPASRVLDDDRWSLGTTPHLSACMGVACTAPRKVRCVFVRP